MRGSTSCDLCRTIAVCCNKPDKYGNCCNNPDPEPDCTGECQAYEESSQPDSNQKENKIC